MQVRQLAGLPLLPLASGGVCTLSTARGSGGGVDAVFLATGADRKLLAALPHLVVDAAVLGTELSQRSVSPNMLEVQLADYMPTSRQLGTFVNPKTASKCHQPSLLNAEKRC